MIYALLGTSVDLIPQPSGAARVWQSVEDRMEEEETVGDGGAQGVQSEVCIPRSSARGSEPHSFHIQRPVCTVDAGTNPSSTTKLRHLPIKAPSPVLRVTKMTSFPKPRFVESVRLAAAP